MKLLGAPDDVIEEAEGKASEPAEEASFGVFEENWQRFNFFLSLQTRWKWIALTNGKVKRTGLDWPSVEMRVNRKYPRKERDSVLDELEMLEVVALKVFSEK